jgi:phosphatidylserine decarboxylase
MSFLDVHVNRSPLSGTIEEARHIPGRFLSLKRPEALTQNERALTVMRVGPHAVGVVQIASRLVRRIVSYVSPGDTVKVGQRIGMIKFGSQVDLILPTELGAQIQCRVGQQVHAGLTIIAEHGHHGG